MVRVREARRAYKKYAAKCFWSFDPNYKITLKDVPWVAKQLRQHGNLEAFQIARKLCL